MHRDFAATQEVLEELKYISHIGIMLRGIECCRGPRLVAEVIPSFHKYSWRIMYYFRPWVYKIHGVPSWSTQSRGGDVNIHKYLQHNMIWTTIVLSA